MSLLDVGVERCLTPGANGFDEVSEVIAVAVEAAHHLAIWPIGDRRGIARTNEITIRAVKDIAYRSAAVRARFQTTNFEDEFAIAVVEEAELAVSCLAVVGVAKAAAHAPQRTG